MNMLNGIIILACIGVINTLYLSYHAYHKTFVRCIFFPPEWCKAVQQSKYSKTLNVPNPYLGLIMYLAIIGLSILFSAGLLPFWPVMIVVSIGFAFSMYFTIMQAFVIKAFCTWCVLSAIDFVLLFTAIWFV